ncbi:Methylamine utilization protein MauD [Maioricimonas rarisocia]|uniref:Methylamine utilization protein MauD n=1 Tax=Maioricimonas rarisocia TaxID=2528026 RepID=A0A517Z3T5_9PLAN|nr:TlpA disulfide reductase family protein [Maioricimonas rarisocia]QDU37087.1 Methylamine utilization protein MauD [Maioricimonas rarisocia]
MTGTRLLRGFAALLIFGTLSTHLPAQDILSDDLLVRDSLRPFDRLLQKQLRVWFDSMDAALTEDGTQSPEWWRTSERLNPLTVHGGTLLDYARDHAGSPEALACLAYIVDWGEGRPRELFRSACDELLASYADDPAMSWLCSRFTNAICFDEMESFLTRLRETSSSPAVQAAADFHLAELIDQALQMQKRLPVMRERFESTGALQGLPTLGHRLDRVAALDSRDLTDRRDRLLKQVCESATARPWSAKRMQGRLDYEFFEDPDAESFQQRAAGLLYETAHLRVGSIAPAFEGTLSDGRPFRLGDRRGQPTLLMFSFKGCVACEAMYPALRAVQKRYADAGFSVVGIMADENVGTVSTAIETGAITWPCVWDGPSGPIARAFRVRGHPVVLLLDGEGRIVAKALREERHLDAAISELVGGE